MKRQRINELRQWDRARPGFTGEHWLAMGAGLLALRHAQRSKSAAARLAGRAVGTALLVRAASGRDGLIGKLASRPTLLSRVLAGIRSR